MNFVSLSHYWAELGCPYSAGQQITNYLILLVECPDLRIIGGQKQFCCFQLLWLSGKDGPWL